MDDVTKTDKMLSRKDGRVGYVIFNNPERHNAVSLDMWAATSRILEDFAKDDEVRVVHVVSADSEAQVRETFARDNWSESVLRVEDVDRWPILLDGR